MEQIGTIIANALNSKENSLSQTPSQKLKSVGELKELLTDYAPNKQAILCKDKSLCYFGQSPTLAELNHEYDPLAARAFLIPQLTDIAKFSNCMNVMNAEQINALADMIISEYYYLKMSELMLFCWKFKCVEYGQFYGSVSPMLIMTSIKKFIRERNEAIFLQESKLREKRDIETRKGAISAQEYFGPKARVITDYFASMANTIESLISLTIQSI